jgi:hypothetical protein
MLGEMMEQNSSSKVVSLHLQGCFGFCQNASVCYHKNKVIDNREFKCNEGQELRIRLLEQDYRVHESICSMDNKYHTDLAKEYPNYHITISVNEINRNNDGGYRKSFIDQIKDQVQVSVYHLEEIQNYKDFQKLFLITSWETLGEAYQYMKMDTGRLHFLIDKGFISNTVIRQRIQDFIKNFQNRKDPLQSADTCLTSWLINGHCPYDKDYLDITYDKTARKCPYAQRGISMNNLELDSINAYMSLHSDYHYVCDPIFKCIYKDIFKGEGHEQFEGADIQNQAANNGNGSNSKRVRGFSLRR